jgi:flavoprotein hydroxylase
VALAGDAAHQMPPFFGQGLCSGLRDAMNLAWKLDVILRGAGSLALLDTYTAERGAHVQHAIGMSVELGRVICLTDPDAVAERDRHLLAAGGRPDLALPPVPPPRLGEALGFRGADGALRPPGGTLTEQARLRDATGRTGTHDEIAGTGFVIASTLDPATMLGPDLRRRLAGIGARMVWIRPRGSALPVAGEVLVAEDVDDHYLPHLAEAGAVAVVVRPDFYLFGVARVPQDLPVVVAQLLAQLCAAHDEGESR